MESRIWKSACSARSSLAAIGSSSTWRTCWTCARRATIRWLGPYARLTEAGPWTPGLRSKDSSPMPGSASRSAAAEQREGPTTTPELEADPGIGDESFERSPGVHGPRSQDHTSEL